MAAGHAVGAFTNSPKGVQDRGKDKNRQTTTDRSKPREQIQPNRQKQTETNPDNQREAWGFLREAQRCSESWRGPGRPRDV